MKKRELLYLIPFIGIVFTSIDILNRKLTSKNKIIIFSCIQGTIHGIIISLLFFL